MKLGGCYGPERIRYIYEIADSGNWRVKKIQTLGYNRIDKNNIINKSLNVANVIRMNITIGKLL